MNMASLVSLEQMVAEQALVYLVFEGRGKDAGFCCISEAAVEAESDATTSLSAFRFAPASRLLNR